MCGREKRHCIEEFTYRKAEDRESRRTHRTWFPNSPAWREALGHVKFITLARAHETRTSPNEKTVLSNNPVSCAPRFTPRQCHHIAFVRPGRASHSLLASRERGRRGTARVVVQKFLTDKKPETTKKQTGYGNTCRAARVSGPGIRSGPDSSRFSGHVRPQRGALNQTRRIRRSTRMHVVTEDS